MPRYERTNQWWGRESGNSQLPIRSGGAFRQCMLLRDYRTLVNLFVKSIAVGAGVLKFFLMRIL